QALAVEHHDELSLLELLGLVHAAVPDLDVAGSVTAFRDLSVEVEVGKRVVLYVDGHVVLLRILRDPARDGPGHQRAIALHARSLWPHPRRVLVPDEAPRRRRGSRGGSRPHRLGRRAGPGRGLWRAAKIALGPILAQPPTGLLSGHRTPCESPSKTTSSR